MAVLGCVDVRCGAVVAGGAQEISVSLLYLSILACLFHSTLNISPGVARSAGAAVVVLGAVSLVLSSSVFVLSTSHSLRPSCLCPFGRYICALLWMCFYQPPPCECYWCQGYSPTEHTKRVQTAVRLSGQIYRSCQCRDGLLRALLKTC